MNLAFYPRSSDWLPLVPLPMYSTKQKPVMILVRKATQRTTSRLLCRFGLEMVALALVITVAAAVRGAVAAGIVAAVVVRAGEACGASGWLWTL